MTDDVAVRAERLRVLLALHQGGDTLGAEGCKEAFRAGLGPVSELDLELMATMEPEDHALGLACYAIEADLRRRGWAALEWLAAVLPEPNIEAALETLSRQQLVELVRAVRDLGWIGPAPGEADERPAAE